MILSIIYSLPCMVSFLWALIFVFKVKNYRQKLFSWILTVSVFCMATFTVYNLPETDYYVMVRMDAVNVPLSIIMAALWVLYMDVHRTKCPIRPIKWLILAPALIVGTGVWLLYFILGFDSIARMTEYMDNTGTMGDEFSSPVFQLHYFLTYDLFILVSFGYMILLLWECISVDRNEGYHFGDLFRFFFKKHSTTPSRSISSMVVLSTLLMIPYNMLGRAFMIEHVSICIVFVLLETVLLFFICFVEFFSYTPWVTLYQLSHFNLESESVADIVTTDKKETSAMDRVTELSAARTMILAEKFQKLMEEEKVYKEDDLTMATLSEKLGVGRTTLSTMISSQYGIPFREVVNRFRIEAAKKYMLENPTATQEVIAYETGFKDASAFNRKFKEAVGDTPFMWLAKQSSANSQ